MKSIFTGQYFNKVFLCLLGLKIIFVLGCSTPNVAPFAESTEIIRTSFKVGSTKVVTSLRLVGEKTEADKLEKDLKPRYAVLDALLVFTSNIASIQADSDLSKQGVQEMASAASKLSVMLGGGALAPVTALANEIAAQALEIKEFYLISSGLNAIKPHIDDLADLLGEDMVNFNQAYDDTMIDVFVGLVGKRIKLVKENKSIKTKVLKLQEKLASNDPAPTAEEFALFAALHPVHLAQQQEIKAIKAEEQKLRLEQPKRVAFFNTFGGAMIAWKQAYKDLTFAFEKNKQVNFTALYLKTQEIQALVDAL